MKTSKNNVTKDNKEYIEVLGDTVYGSHMILTIIISVCLGLGGFLLGQYIFTNVASENMVDSYSLLLGIAGLIIALAINSLLFKPKRKLLEEENSLSKMNEIFTDYHLNLEEEREDIKNNPTVTREMKKQGIYNMFFPDEEEHKK